MRGSFLPFSRIPLDGDEARAIGDVIGSGWITTGPIAAQLEQEFSAAVAAPAAVAVSSCTAALHLGLVGAGIGSGDEVITSPLTFASTVNVIEQVGATPVLVDIEPDTLNIDASLVDAAVTDRTKAIIPVHYAGHPCELEALGVIAAANDLLLLEDAAHAFPATYHGRSVGSGPNPVAFSFYATKNITTAEGGMLTGDPDMIERARVLSLHGMTRNAWNRYDGAGSWRYDVTAPGFKYNLPDVLAAMGLAQLGRVADFQRRRREVVAAYQAAFSEHPAVEVPVERPYVEHAWHLYVVRLRCERLSIDRDRFIEEMKARNIGTSVHFIPIYSHSYYRDSHGWSAGDFPVTASASERIVSLPLSPALTDDDVADVIEAVLDVLDAYGR